MGPIVVPSPAVVAARARLKSTRSPLKHHPRRTEVERLANRIHRVQTQVQQPIVAGVAEQRPGQTCIHVPARSRTLLDHLGHRLGPGAAHGEPLWQVAGEPAGEHRIDHGTRIRRRPELVAEAEMDPGVGVVGMQRLDQRVETHQHIPAQLRIGVVGIGDASTPEASRELCVGQGVDAYRRRDGFTGAGPTSGVVEEGALVSGPGSRPR